MNGVIKPYLGSWGYITLSPRNGVLLIHTYNWDHTQAYFMTPWIFGRKISNRFQPNPPNRRRLRRFFSPQVGALEKCEEGISKILSTDVKERWSEAGGKIETIPEAKTAQLGDKQRRKWFKRSLGTNYENSGGWFWCFCWGGAVELHGVLFEVLRILFVGLVCFSKTKVTWLAKWVWGLGSTGECRAVDVSTILTTKNQVLQREREKKLGSCDGRKFWKNKNSWGWFSASYPITY